MIDTVALVLTADMFKITDPDLFTPSARWIDSCTRYNTGMQSKQNPTKKDLARGIYKPRLTLSRCYSGSRTKELMLRIEFSAPKLLFGNNFDELRYKDFAAVVNKLAETLKHMGVAIDTKTLAQAPVCAIHYSKNIALTDGSTPFHYINKIKDSCVKLSLDTTESAYRNGGHGYKWHCNAYEVAFYDKIKDLEKAKQSSKLAFEKDSDLQLSLLDMLAKRHMLEYLRMEVRLNKREAIKHLMTKLAIRTNCTFKGLFKVVIAKKVLLHYLDQVESNWLPLLDYKTKNGKALLATLRCENPGISHKQIFQALGLMWMLEFYTLRELQGMFGKNAARSWQRLMSDAKSVRVPRTHSSLAVIRVGILKFKPTKTSSI